MVLRVRLDRDMVLIAGDRLPLRIRARKIESWEND